ncbi:MULTISPECIES: 5-histidylcysteine sulfoxide synthase [unclassified Sulfurospirillum]|uniref:5-histidylcysteine sulfoxide synthase n=1 Tax=unclassified Sulfurospirillum TaxID=2618290 RepID=UPI000508C917|nr:MULTISPECIES: 5-histidylcysteine sulfoxide synthase [unclassified Sulfurospirillum]KFL34065.1 SAM-dependent methyltransferase [Sulfurospirillum sp. SCADC]
MQLIPTRNILLNQGTSEQKRQEIKEYFLKTYTVYEKLFELMSDDESYYLTADPLRHPLVFYFGHTATFFINKLVLAKLIDKRINPTFESIFAIGVDEMSWDDLNQAHYTWPRIAEIRAYREQVKAKILELIDTLPLSMPISWESPFWAILMGIEHERIHLETSSVLIRQLPLEHVVPNDFWKVCPLDTPVVENSLLHVKGTTLRLEKKKDDALYGWDNEYGLHVKEVKDFKASKFLVSNAEFLGFIEDNGYENEAFWNEEGWKWKTYKNATMPLFWRKDDAGYKLRLMAEEIAMPWSWPVEINYLEAKAFCNWKSAKESKSIRLPIEEEWYVLRDLHVKVEEPFWDKAPANINLEYFASSVPVDTFAFGDFYDVIGNVWQWSETPMNGFDGFAVHPLYDDFSVPTFDDRHNIIKGGSWISTGNEIIRASRYAFRRHFYQHAGFRYVESNEPVETHSVFYETDFALSKICDAHFGDKENNYYEAMAQFCIALGGNKDKALEIGCGVGRGTFALARHFAMVHGIEFTARVVRLATNFKESGKLKYALKEEGELALFIEKNLSDFDIVPKIQKVEFWQADPHNMKPYFDGYDLILANDILDTLYDPALFLEKIKERLNPQGFLVIASSYDWDEAKTPRAKWLGGIKKNGEKYSTFDALNEHLSPFFDLHVTPVEMRLSTHESARKEVVKSLHVSVWKKK